MIQEALDYIISGQIPEQTKEVSLEVTLGAKQEYAVSPRKNKESSVPGFG